MARHRPRQSRVEFLFVNKNEKSLSLSHSKKTDENGDIQSHVQSRYRQKARSSSTSKTKKTDKNPITKPPSFEASQIVFEKAYLPSPSTSDDHDCGEIFLAESDIAANESSEKTRPSKRCRPASKPRDSFDGLKTIPSFVLPVPKSPSPSSIDVFDIASYPIDEETYDLLQYPFTSFVATKTRSESFAYITNSPADSDPRHQAALLRLLRRCSTDKLILNATLSFASSCIRWAVGKNENSRPPEFYNVKTLEALQAVLRKSYSVDSWLLWVIGALVACELLSDNPKAAKTHMRMAQHLIDASGGTTQFDAFVVETLILKDKYLAIFTFERPILSLDYDPGPLLEDEWVKIQCNLPSDLFTMAQRFFSCSQLIAFPELKSIIIDLVDCVQIAHTTDFNSTGHNEAVIFMERWLFLRQNALIHRLMSLSCPPGVQECCRIALILWLLKVTPSLSARRASRSVVPRLQEAAIAMQIAFSEADYPLLFWILSVGTMSAEFMQERDWFARETAKIASQLCLPVEKDAFREQLRHYFFLESEDGLQLFRFVRVVKGAQSDFGIDVSF